MKKRICALLAGFLASLFLLASCSSTYTAILYGGGNGNGNAVFPGIGSQEQGQSGGQKEQNDLPDDHLFKEAPLKSRYEGLSANGIYFIVDFSSGLSQAMGQGKYLFARKAVGNEALSAVKAEIAGKSPYLTVSGKNGYALYTLEGHENLRRVAINFTDPNGKRVLALFDYQEDALAEIDEYYKTDAAV